MLFNYIVRSSFVISLCIGAPLVMANHIFSIGEGGDKSWQQAMQDGDVAAANNLTQAAIDFYSTQDVESFAAVAPELYTNSNVEGHDSLVMSWDIPQDQGLQVAAWDYNFGVEHELAVSDFHSFDLSKGTIHFSIFAPIGVWDLSLEMIDINGNSVGWFLSMPLHDVWQEFWFKTNNFNDQLGFSFFDGGNFDLTNVSSIRLNESGIWSMPFSLTPPMRPDGSIPDVPAWNAWNHLRIVVPEPGTVALFFVAMAGLGYSMRKRVLNPIG
jgi:hypothetical protein